MDDYFKDVVSSLSIDDMNILGILYDNEALATFKAINGNEVFETSGLSEATYRKIIYRLIANKFVEAVTLKRQHSLFITQYGATALKTSLEGMSA